MKRSALQIYALAVCFSTLLCFVVALGIGLYDVVQIVTPSFTVSPYYSQAYQSPAEFARYDPDRKDVSNEELASLRESALLEASRIERQSALQSLIQVLIVLLIDAGVYAFHWRIAKRCESQFAAALPMTAAVER